MFDYYLISLLITMPISNIISTHYETISTVKIGENGYKYKDNASLSQEVRKLINDNRLKIILFNYFPIINIFVSKKLSDENSKARYDDLLNNGSLVEMTDKEKNEFKKIKRDKDKYVYIKSNCKFISYRDWFKSEFGYFKKSKNNNNSFNNERKIRNISLDYREIPPLKYNLDDVEKFNSVTDNNYILGKVDERNVAIINLPVSYNDIESIIFSDNKVHKFTKIDVEEANDKNFVIYPYGIDFDKDEKLKEVYENIRKEKHPDDRDSSTVITPRLISYNHKPLTKNMTIDNK